MKLAIFSLFAVVISADLGLCEMGPRLVVEPPRELVVWHRTGGVAGCQASGSPPPHISWSMANDPGPLSPVPHLRRVLDNGSLYFPPFSPDQFRPDVHMTTYRCMASNSAGKLLSLDLDVRAAVVDVYEAVAELVGGEGRRFYVGDTAVLRCRLPHHLDPIVTVTAWLIDESYNVYPTTDGEGKYVMLPWNGDLHVLNLTLADSSRRYSCRTLHRLTGHSQHSNPISVPVSDNPKASKPQLLVPAEYTVIARRTDGVILPCVANGQPPPVYIWYRDNSPMQMTERKQLVGGSLLLRSVGVEDSGNYMCSVNNSIGLAQTTATLIVPKPLTVHINPSTLRVDSGSNAIFNCITTAVQLSWYKDGVDTGVRSPKLEIESVRKEDQGVYQCRASLGKEQAYAVADLRLGASKPQLVYQFLEHTLQPGPAVSLKCIATGNPTPQITWGLDGYPLPQNDRFVIGQYVTVSGDVISHVNLSKVSVEDGGMYMCTASNRAGSVFHQAPLRVYGPPVVRKIPPISAVAGKHLTITCPVGGYPIHSITWEKDGRVVGVNHRLRVYNNGTLILSNVQSKVDHGTYTCTATNRQGHSARASVDVAVLEPPVLSGLGPTQAGLVGERLGLQCLVTRGQVPIQLQWLHYDTPVLKLNLPSLSVSSPAEYSSTLLFESLSPLHRGNYTCEATNSAATVTSTVQLYVNEPAEITAFTLPTLEIGSRLQATCTVHKGDPPLNITWSKDGMIITRDISMYNVYTSILSIAQVKREDSGNYTCKASNLASTVHHTAQLIVTVPPEWMIEPRDTSAVVGQPVALHCSADGYPKPTINWRKSIGKDSGQFGEKEPASENGTLFIPSVAEKDEGYYLCEAYNGIGAGLSAVVFLLVNALPKFVSGGRKVVSRRGSSATLNCEARGDLPLLLKWQRNHVTISQQSDKYILKDTLSEVSNTLNSQLIIKNTIPTDSGKYVCIASNPYGRDETVVHLSIQDVPEPPKEVRIVDTGSRSLKISWSQPQDNNSPITHYSISYSVNPDDWPEPEDIKGLWTWHKITNLIPSTKYLLRVYASNHVGMSPASTVVTAMTGPEMPSGPPTQISATAISNSQILLSWQPPVPEHRNAPILGYYIGYKPAFADESRFNYTTIDVSSDMTPEPYIISNLNSYTRYSLTVQAFNVMGGGPTCQPVFATTLEAAPGGSPRDITCKVITSQSIELTWSPPEKSSHNGIIVGYKVLYQKIPPLNDLIYESVEETKDSESEVLVLTSLEKYSNYSIEIGAFTAAGLGPKSSPVHCSTPEDLPGSPTYIKVVQSNIRNVIVTWVEPSEPNGVITRFNLYQRELTAGNGAQVRSLSPQSRSIMLSIKLGITYEWWITAINSVGESPPTSVVSLTPGKTILARIQSIGSYFNIPLGNRVDLECNCVGIPNPAHKWSHNSKDLASNNGYQLWPNRTLTLNHASHKHSGNYTCTVHNIHSTDRITHYLRVLGPPAAPVVQIISIATNNITIGWTRPKHALALLNYIFHYRFVDGPSSWEEAVLANKVEQYTITNLTCGTKIQVKLCAENRVGIGAVSSILDVSTLSPIPSPPMPQQAITSSTNALIIHLELWRHFDCPISRFIIERKLHNHQDWTFVTECLAGSSYIMSGLQPSTFYHIRVTSQTSAGKTTHYFHASTLTPHGEINSGDMIWEQKEKNPYFIDLRIGLPIIASIFALIFTLTTVTLCLRHRVWNCSHFDRGEEPECQQHPEYYAALQKKPERPNPNQSYQDEIYPYATFQMPKTCQGQVSSQRGFQTFVYQGSTLMDVDSFPPGEKQSCGETVHSDEYDSLDDSDIQQHHQHNIRHARHTSLTSRTPLEGTPTSQHRHHTLLKNK